MAGHVGQQLGKYRLIQLIGQGGFAEAYLGEHIYLGTQAAIKVLHTQLAGNEIEQFRQEARIIAHLEHPHIVRVLDFGVQDGVPFLVMTYAPNGTLRQRHQRENRVPLALVNSYVKQVASALQYAHMQHIIHRDIKPENMLLGRNNEVLLSDFGIAMVEQNSLQINAREMGGTVAYMAPEQIEGRPRISSDQYSLGIVVYEWLCGKRPFEGSFVGIIAQHATIPPPSLCAQMPELAPTVEAVVMTALAKDPKQRFASVWAFATAFEQACGLSTPVIGEISSAATVVPPGESFSQRKTPNDVLTPSDLPAPFGLIQPLSGVALPETERGLAIVEARTMLKNGSQAVSPTTLRRPSAQQVLSRRNVLVGLVSLVGIGVVSSGFILAEHLLSAPHLSGTAHTLSSHATPTPSSLSSVTSSGTMFGFDLGHTHYNTQEKVLSSTNAPNLALAWAKPTGGAITSSPTVTNGIVYVGSEDSKLYAFDALSGKILWTVLTLNAIHSSPAIANGVVYVGSEDTYLYAYDAKTGTKLWQTQLGDRVDSSPAVANGVIYIGSNDHNLYALDAHQGTVLWKINLVYPISSSPSVVNGMVYIGSPDAGLHAFDATNGTYKWSTPVGDWTNSSPAVAQDVVYIGSQDGLYAIHALTGDKLWSAITVNRISSSPAVANGVVYIGSEDNRLYALQSGTSKVLWSASTGGKIRSSPFVANGVVYIGSDDGQLYAFDAKTSALLWNMSTGGSIDSSPIVANGMVYVGSHDHKLYAFHLASAAT